MSSQAGTQVPSAGSGFAARFEALRETLGRPLATYYLLLGSCGMLLGIGLLMVLSASSVDSYVVYKNSYYWATRQLIFIALGVPAGLIVSRLPHKLIRRLSWGGLILAALLLIATQTPLGVRVNGNQNWLALGPIQIQPAELAKLAMIAWGADVYARKDKLLGQWRHLMLPVQLVFGVIITLDLAGGDLGTALVMLAIGLGFLWVAGAPLRIFIAAVGLVGSGVGFLAVTSPYRLARLTSFANPFRDFQGTGWQSAHGLLGMSSGGFFGKGLGASQQKWGNLPYAHTDFIFAVLGEELGLLGTLLVLFLFLVFAYAGIRIALQTNDLWVRYVASGIVIWIMAHVLINVGMVLALLPVVGIPLPLVSYGGTSLVTELAALGLLVGFARNDPEAKAALEDKKRARKAGREVSGFNAGRAGRKR